MSGNSLMEAIAKRGLPEEVMELLRSLPPDEQNAALQQLLQASTIEYRQLQESDVAVMKERAKYLGFMPNDLDFTWQEISSPQYAAIGAFDTREDGSEALVGFVIAEASQIGRTKSYAEYQEAAGEKLEGLLALRGFLLDDVIVSIFFLGVDLEYRRQGIGSSLLDFVKQVATQARARFAWLNVAEANVAARGAYERYGFQETDQYIKGDQGSHILYILPIDLPTKRLKQPSHRRAARRARHGGGGGGRGFGVAAAAVCTVGGEGLWPGLLLQQRRASTVTSDVEPSTSAPASPSGRTARLHASKFATQLVQEEEKALADYMALPASQYSVLDARKIERIDDETFRCYVGALSFFSFSVEPVITVRVTVQERGCTIQLLSCTLQGSKMVEDLNSRFTAAMTNVVTWAPSPDPQAKHITSDTSIEVVVQVPDWMAWVAPSSIGAVGSSVMQGTLNLMVPRFLEQLRDDYARWASGDASRKPLGDGGL